MTHDNEAAVTGHEPTQGLHGWITHTDLSSTDPTATKAWCERALGWRFVASIPAEDGGDYHLFAYPDQGGGGLHRVAPGETPASIPYVHVADAQTAFDAAVDAGADPIARPTRVMEGVTTAVVRAPGGVLIGLSGP